MYVTDIYVIAADGCQVRAKVNGFWSGRHPLQGRTIEDFEEWTIEQIEAAENPPSPKREQYECLCCDKIRENYTESQENAIQNEFAIANYKLAMKAELTAEDNEAIASMKSFRDFVDLCKHSAHIEIYGEE